MSLSRHQTEGRDLGLFQPLLFVIAGDVRRSKENHNNNINNNNNNRGGEQKPRTRHNYSQTVFVFLA